MIKIYLDNAATTNPKPREVIDQMKEYLDLGAINIGRGSYKKSKEGYELYEETKRKLAKLCGGENLNVKFSPSATIAFNELIYSLNIKKGETVYITPFEHNAVARPLNIYAEKKGFKIEMIPFDSDCTLDKKEFEHKCSVDKPNYIFINHVSNVIGNVLNINEVLECVNEYNPISIIDASQSIGLVPIDFNDMKIDYLVFAGHKTLYGPLGIAGIVSRKSFSDKEMLLYGGTGSDSLNTMVKNSEEVGSINILAVAGLNAALDWISNKKDILEHERELRRICIKKLSELYGVRIFGADVSEEYSTGIISFVHEDYSPDELGQILDLDFDIEVRTGYHCAPYIHGLIGSDKTLGTVRVSFGYFNTEEDVERFIEAIEEL